MHVISNLKIVAAVTAHRPQHKYILCLMLWPEFPFGPLAQNGAQNFVPEHLEIKFCTINMYAKDVSPVPGHLNSCHSKECAKMGMSTRVLLDCRYVRQDLIEGETSYDY
jgi:hypothetical protein